MDRNSNRFVYRNDLRFYALRNIDNFKTGRRTDGKRGTMKKDGFIINVVFLVASLIIIFISSTWASSIYYKSKEDRAIFANSELSQLQKDFQRLDIRLTRNEIKTRVLENKEIILLNRNVLKIFEKDIEAFEAAIRDYEERIKNENTQN